MVAQVTVTAGPARVDATDRGAACVGRDADATVPAVRCPHCGGDDDKVVDTRSTDDGSAIRRRRECLVCHRRFTTFERVDEVPLVVAKRSGVREPFDRVKIEQGVRAATKGRPVTEEQIAVLALDIEEIVRLEGSEVDSERVGRAVLDRLRELDQVASVRFASVYKDFTDPADFEREVGLLTRADPPPES